jgi:hypothetical protein
MQFDLIGEYEVTVTPGGAPALVVHHVIRGHDVAALGAADAAALRELLGVSQKRIRELGGYRLIFGGGGDLTVYTAAGARACYFTADQAARLAGLLAGVE